MRFSSAATMLAIGIAFCATAARADVFEIGDDGAVRQRGTTAEVQWIDPTAEADNGAIGDTPEAAPSLPVAAITTLADPQVPDAWRIALRSAADQYHLSPDLLAALVWQESRWHPAARSPKGAVGLAQLMPGTARAMAVDASDPGANLAGGARYLRQMLDTFDGDVERALAAYNAGPGRVIAAGGVPAIAETRAYVSTIIDRLTPVSADITTGLLK